MDTSKSRSSSRQNHRLWHSHIQALRKSGLSRAEYCRQHDLSYHAMTYWCRKSNLSDTHPSLIPVPLSLNITEKQTSGLRIRMGARFTVEIDDDFNQATLMRLISVLQAA